MSKRKKTAAPPKTVVVEIPDWRPPLANEWVGFHWSKIDDMKAKAAEFVGLYAVASGLKRTAHDYRVVRKLEVELQVPPGRTFPDPDAVLKVLLDACKRCRVIVDDSAAWCHCGMPKVSRGPTLKTIIRVTDIEVGPPIKPEDDPDVKRVLASITRRFERKNTNAKGNPAPVPKGKRRVPRLG